MRQAMPRAPLPLAAMQRRPHRAIAIDRHRCRLRFEKQDAVPGNFGTAPKEG